MSTPAVSQPASDSSIHHSHVGHNLKAFFNDRAKSYEKGSGGVTRSVATYIVHECLSNLPPNARVLDNACGPAIVTEELLKVHPTSNIDAVDNSEGMIEVVKEMITAQGWEGKVRTDIMEGCDLKLPDDVFDASVTNFGIFMMNPAAKGASEIYRTLKVGGKAVITTWKYVGWPAVLTEIEKTIRPGGKPFGMPELEKWKHRETLEELMKGCGLKDVELSEYPTCIWRLQGDEEEYTKGMAQMIGMMIGDQWTTTEKGKIQSCMDELIADDQRKAKFFVEKDGVLGIEMIAWVGVGRK